MILDDNIHGIISNDISELIEFLRRHGVDEDLKPALKVLVRVMGIALYHAMKGELALVEGMISRLRIKYYKLRSILWRDESRSY